MNDIVNKILLVGDTFMPKMRLEQPGFSHNACVTFTKNRERLQKIKINRILKIYLKSKQDKVHFQRHMAYENFKDLP